MSVPPPPPGWPPGQYPRQVPPPVQPPPGLYRPMRVGYGPGTVPPRVYMAQLQQQRRSMPTDQTTLPSLTWLLLSTALLVASLVLPMLVPPDAHWLTGPTLLNYGPQLLGGEAVDGINVYLVTLTMLTGLCGLGMLLGAARVLTRGWAIALGVLACFGMALGLFTSLVLLIGAMAAEATAGVASFGLPLGYLGCLLACFIPSVRNGWIRPPRVKKSAQQPSPAQWWNGRS